MKLSASTLNLFFRCSYAYYLKEIEKKEPVYSDRVFIGQLVHKVLEKYFKYKKQSPDDPITLMDFLDEAYDSLEQRPEVIKAENYKDESISYIQNYEDVAKNILPKEIEKEFNVDFNDIAIRGFIDLVTEDGKVIDFKTTAQSSVKLSVDYILQLSIYNLAGLGDSFYIHYITPKKFVEFNVNPLNTDVLSDILNRFKLQYESGVFVPSGLTHPFACQYCAYSAYCNFYNSVKL
ncbi:MAG: RecB family exonuclease [Brevinematia bacterium]